VSGRGTIIAMLGLIGFYTWFDAAGGFYNLPRSLEAAWVVIPTIEGVGLATFVAWYDRNPIQADNAFMRLVRRAGDYSYAIYLLHFFFVFVAAEFVHRNVTDISTLPRALPWALLFYLLMMPIGHASSRFIEKPMLAYRKRYVLD
jgi:peptidoglycan/LPS O-acetylase OafA/YrhL